MMKFNSLKLLVLSTLITLLSAQPVSAMQFTPWMNAFQTTASKMLSGASQFIQEHKWASAGIGVGIIAAYAGAVGYGAWRSIQGKNIEIENLRNKNQNLSTAFERKQAAQGRILQNYSNRSAELKQIQQALEIINLPQSTSNESSLERLGRLSALLTALQKNVLANNEYIDSLTIVNIKLSEENKTILHNINTLLDECRKDQHLNGNLKQQLDLLQKQLQERSEGPQEENHPFVKAGLVKAEGSDWRFDPEILKSGFTVKLNGSRDFEKPHRIIYETIRPNVAIKNPKICLIGVHGTFATDEEFGQNPNAPLSQELMNFGKGLALTNNCEVEISYFRWTGELSSQARKKAGAILGAYLNEKVIEGCKIVTVAHSHGCNVVAWAAEELKKLTNPAKIETAIQLAWPAEETSAPWQKADKTKCTVNIDTVFHFYSNYDLTQNAGSLQAIWRPQRKAHQSLTSKIYNIHTTAQEDEAQYGRLDHISIKVPTIRNLFGLIFKAETFYDCFTDLSAGIFASNPSKLPIMLIREQITDCERAVRVNLERSRRYNDEQLKQLEENGFRCARFTEKGGWFGMPHIIKLLLGESRTAVGGDVYSATKSNLKASNSSGSEGLRTSNSSGSDEEKPKKEKELE